MSRCFRYPPPHRGESLIESIKLQKEKVKAKKEKEKKEKREKREKANHRPVNSQHQEKSHKKRKYQGKSLLDQKYQYSQKTSYDVIEQLEKSGLTEEHELPCSIQYKHDSPESSQDSNKRRKLVPSVSSHNKHGTVLRIKLPSLRQRDSELLLPSSKNSELPLPTLQQRDSEVPLPSSRKVDSDQPLPVLKQKNSELPCAKTVGQEALPKLKQMVNERPTVGEQPCFSGRDVAIALDQEVAPSSHRASSSKRVGGRTWQKKQFGELILNWNPPQVQLEPSLDIDGDEEWLFGAPKRQFRPDAKEPRMITGLSGCGIVETPQQPCAFYLPELDMYQLPYVVPF